MLTSPLEIEAAPSDCDGAGSPRWWRPETALLSTVQRACSCRRPPARRARHCGSVPATAVRVGVPHRLHCPFLTLSRYAVAQVAPVALITLRRISPRAFQQPYDATVSEIDPMDLATPAQDQRKSIGRLTRLMARSLSIVWQSARTPFLALIGLQLLNAIALALQIFAVRLALTAVLEFQAQEILGAWCSQSFCWRA